MGEWDIIADVVSAEKMLHRMCVSSTSTEVYALAAELGRNSTSASKDADSQADFETKRKARQTRQR